METELTIEGGGFPPFSARGCQQVLTPIRNGEYRRTVEGKLMFIGNDSHHKYHTKIQGQDKTIPAIEKWWRGQHVRVGCIQRLSHEFVGNGVMETIKLARLPVDGSVIIFDEQQEAFQLANIEGLEVTLKEIPSPGKHLFVSYRPLLEMMMTHHAIQTDEWGHQVGWVIELEEV